MGHVSHWIVFEGGSWSRSDGGGGGGGAWVSSALLVFCQGLARAV